jgi:hypothetical protein
MAFASQNHFDPPAQDHCRLLSHASTSSKQDDHSQADGEDSFSTSGPGLFINLNGTSVNPLFSHDRQFINVFAQHLSGQPLEPGLFTPTSADLDVGQLSGSGHEERHAGNSVVKLESHLYDGLENQSPVDLKGEPFSARAFWGAPNSEADLHLQDGLHHDENDI